MSRDKILSVSIAAYNVAAYLEETLDCFVGVRGMERLDVMIVDDGSTDGTAAIARRYAERWPQTFRVLSKQNGGWGSTVNTGIDEAKGRYFKVLDGDDFFVREHIAPFLDALEHLDADLVLTPSHAFDSASGRRLYSMTDYLFPANYRAYPVDRMNMYFFTPSVYGVCFRAAMLRDSGIRITEHCFYTDVEYVLKGCNQAYTAAGLPMELYCYRKARSGQSMSLEGVRRHYMEHYKMLTTLLAYDRDEVTRPAMHEMFNARLTAAAFNMYKWFLFQEPTPEHRRQLMDYDRMLREQYPAIYHTNVSKMVGLLRRTGFALYEPLARRQLRLDQKNRVDIFA